MQSKFLVIYGGQSAEHEISIISATNILGSIDTQFSPALIYITKSGDWQYRASSHLLAPIECYLYRLRGTVRLRLADDQEFGITAAFPVMHGTLGEDGKLQGFLEVLGVPYVGCDTTSSALCMDKGYFKHIMQSLKLPVLPFKVIESDATCTYEEISKELNSSVLFIKPCNMGSSIGISKVKNSLEFTEGIKVASRYDKRLIVEQCLVGREIECAILEERGKIFASELAEIKPNCEFYSYEAKYSSSSKAELVVPAPLNESKKLQCQNLAQQAFIAAGCRGMARIDFFIDQEDNIYINEINTIPGFTNISMYPKLLEFSGISQKELISRLINCCLSSGKNK